MPGKTRNDEMMAVKMMSVDEDVMLRIMEELRETRKQLHELMNRKDPKDLTVLQVVNAYLDAHPDDVCEREWQERQETLPAFAESVGAKRISEVGALDVALFLKRRPGWVSPSTIGHKIAVIKRAFHWAIEERMIREFPFRGVKKSRPRSRRPMTDETYLTIVRNTPAYFRRFLLFLYLTGCRPSEAAKLRWSDIHWDRSIALIKEHKTAKKTGKPRTLFFQPVVIRLLRWLQNHPPRPSSANWLAGLLTDHGELTIRQVRQAAKKEGISVRSTWEAKIAIGAEIVGGKTTAKNARYVLRKPPRRQYQDDDTGEFVFLNKGVRGRTKWCKESLNSMLYRLRRKGVLPKGTGGLYGLRHRHALELVKSGVQLAVIATLMGHSQIATTMMYVSTIQEDVDLMLQELQKLRPGPKQP